MITRDALVTSAREWIGTPYVQRGQLRGVGTDCAFLLYKILVDAELMEPQSIGVFSSDWWAHTTDEKYLKSMLRYASKVAETVCSPSLKVDPGNIILCRTAGGHVYNHGAIITAWPRGIHAARGGVVEVDLTRDPMWILKDVAILDPFVKPVAE